MKSYVERGFFAVKMKIGGVDLDTDLRRIQVAREALGDERKLFLDLK
jgi:L-alanine-DL-glutamate epimerase-like enolase superfamily enzyme